MEFAAARSTVGKISETDMVEAAIWMIATLKDRSGNPEVMW